MRNVFWERLKTFSPSYPEYLRLSIGSTLCGWKEERANQSNSLTLLPERVSQRDGQTTEGEKSEENLQRKERDRNAFIFRQFKPRNMQKEDLYAYLKIVYVVICRGRQLTNKHVEA